MLLFLIRWFLGTTKCSVTGNKITQFVNRLNENKITVWELVKINNTLYLRVFSNEVSNLERLVKICGAKLMVNGNFGLPFIITRHKKRFGILIGILLFPSLIYVCSLYVWNIQIIGINNISSLEVQNSLQNIGIHAGVLTSSIEPQICAQLLIREIPKISWASINISGSCVNVNIKEKVDTPAIEYEQNLPIRLKASRDGYIQRIETYKGTALVNAGDSVIEGQILITADPSEAVQEITLEDKDLDENNIKIEKNEPMKYYSSGKVWANTIRKFNEVLSNTKEITSETKNQRNIYKLWIFGKTLNLSFFAKIPEGWKENTCVSVLKIKKMELPFKMIRNNFIQMQTLNAEVNREESIVLARQKIEEKIRKECENITIQNREEQIFKTKNKENQIEEVLEITLKCFENIAV